MAMLCMEFYRQALGLLLKVYRCIVLCCSYSCGYRKAFDQYVNILKQKYPELHIEGENFIPPGYNMLIAKVLVIKFIV